MKNTFTIFLIFCFNITFSQYSDKIKNIIVPLQGKDTARVYESQLSDVREELFANSNLKELISLAKSKENAFIKQVAIDCIIKKDKSHLLELFEYYLNSTEIINSYKECLIDSKLLPSYILDFAINGEPEVSEEEKQKYFELILKSNNPKLLEENHYSFPENEKFYNLLRSTAIENHSKELLYAVAIYKKEQDINLIMSFGKDAFQAIEQFPSEQFLPFLVNYIDNKDYNYYTESAISSICSNETIKVLNRLIENEKVEIKNVDYEDNFLSDLYQTINLKNCNLFYPILENLWKTNKIISFDVIQNYKNNHSQNEFENFLMQGFILSGEPKIINYISKENSKDSTFNSDNWMISGGDDIENLIKVIEQLKANKLKYQEAVKSSLLNVSSLDFSYFVKQLNDHPTILLSKDIILRKMAENKNAYELLRIMDGIKLLKDVQLFKLGFEIIKNRKQEFLSSKIWSVSLTEFLNKNNLKL